MKEKLTYWLTVLLIIFLPTQIGRHFWYDGALVMGRRIDYLAPTIYLTDIIILLLFFIWVVNKIISPAINNVSSAHLRCVFPRGPSHIGGVPSRCFSSYIRRYPLVVCGVLLCVSWAVGNLWSAENKIITAWYFLKIMEYVWLGWFLARLRQGYGGQAIWKFLAIPMIYESVLAILQVIGQKSVGGIWWWLGERSFSAATPGIAQFVWNGELFLRGYGTLPHPNVLAGFLLISLILIKNIKIIPRNGIPNLVGIKIIKNIKIITIMVALTGIFISGSRLIWGLVAVWGVYEIISKINNFLPAINNVFSAHLRCVFPRGPSHIGGVPSRCFSSYIRCYPLVVFGILVCVSCLFLVLRYVNFSDPSIILRLKLNGIAWRMFTDHWLFGVGLMNFVGQLPHYTRDFEILKFLQPAHNVFLLAASEIGLIGLIGLICLIWSKRHAIFARKNLFLLFIFVIISLFDHYFWTTQQGQIIILLVFVKFISGFNVGEQINKVEQFFSQGLIRLWRKFLT